MFFFFFKQKTAYEIKECDWSSDVCSSDLWKDPRDYRTNSKSFRTRWLSLRRKHSGADIHKKSSGGNAAPRQENVRRAGRWDHPDHVSFFLRNDFERRSAQPAAAGDRGPLD